MAYKNPQRKNFFEALYTKISKPISTILVRTSFTPNQITIISGIFGIVGAYFLTYQSRLNLIYAAVFIQLFTILDLVDGDIARMKNMQSHFGKWLDVLFDKLNDFLIVTGLSIGIYWRTNNIYSLYLGIILMGLLLLINKFMVTNAMVQSGIIIAENTNVKKTRAREIFKKRSSYVVTFMQFISKHCLLEHSTFLFFVSFFILINQMMFGLYFITLHAIISFLFIVIVGGWKIYIQSKLN